VPRSATGTEARPIPHGGRRLGYPRPMRTVVIGGTLFMNRAIVGRLAASGHDVSVLHLGSDVPAASPASRNREARTLR
jgi:hypothetical protein